MKDYWNYRILARRTEYDIEFGFYEVHYENDVPVACTQNSVGPIGFSSEIKDPVESLKWQLDAMKLALAKPILDYDFFPQEYKAYYRKLKLKNIQEVIDKLESTLENSENNEVS